MHGVLAESARDPLLRLVIGAVELTLALALTLDRAMRAEESRAQSVALFLRLTSAVESGKAEEGMQLFEACRTLDRNQTI